MPSWWRLHDRRDGLLPWHATNTAVVLTPRYVVGLLAFLICVDMTQVLGVLCYQLFLGTYFPWHLYPLMLNRAVELLALLCSDGHVPSVGTGTASNSMFEGQDNIKDYNDVIIAVEQPDGEKYAIARLLKDVAIAPPVLGTDEGSSHSKDKKNTAFKEKTRCESAQENLPSCKNPNPLEKSEVPPSKLEGLRSDDMEACEIRTSRTTVCGQYPRNQEQSGLKVQTLEMDELKLMKAETKQDEEELASNVFLSSLTTEIVSFFELQDRLELPKEHHETQS